MLTHVTCELMGQFYCMGFFLSLGGYTGVTNVICDIPEQTVVVSSSLPPQVIVSLIRRVFLNAHILNYIDPHRAAVYPAEPPFSLPGHRYAYDDTYSYWGHTNYTPAYENAYRGRAYDNEFRPSRYSPYTYHWEQGAEFSGQKFCIGKRAEISVINQLVLCCCCCCWLWIWYGFNQSSERLYIRNIKTSKLREALH
jgi:hypothetical protein